jgi:cell division protein FtsW (lipid II flippase)
MILAEATNIDWAFAGQVSGYGFVGVFIAMTILALVIWLVGKCHKAFDEKLKGKGVLVGLIVLLVLAALIAAHIVTERGKESTSSRLKQSEVSAAERQAAMEDS